MPFTAEDKIIIKHYMSEKGYQSINQSRLFHHKDIGIK